MQIEIRFSNEEMFFMKHLFYWIPRFKKWYLGHWKRVFGCKPYQPAPDIYIWWPKRYPGVRAFYRNTIRSHCFSMYQWRYYWKKFIWPALSPTAFFERKFEKHVELVEDTFGFYKDVD